MTDFKLKFGTDTSLTVTGLSTLANGSSATSATIDNSSAQYFDIKLEVKFTTASGAVALTWVEVWAKGSLDNTDFSSDANDFWVTNLAVTPSGAASYIGSGLSLASAFPGGTLTPYVQVRIKNNTGAALTAGTVSYLGVTTQSA